MPISYLAISSFAHDHGIAGKDFADFKRVLQKLDRVFLEVEAEKERAAKQGGKPS